MGKQVLEYSPLKPVSQYSKHVSGHSFNRTLWDLNSNLEGGIFLPKTFFCDLPNIKRRQ
jgi:hypothetical protein